MTRKWQPGDVALITSDFIPRRLCMRTLIHAIALAPGRSDEEVWTWGNGGFIRDENVTAIEPVLIFVAATSEEVDW